MRATDVVATQGDTHPDSRLIGKYVAVTLGAVYNEHFNVYTSSAVYDAL